MFVLGVIAVPEAENLAATSAVQGEAIVARAQAIAGELQKDMAVDWDDVLARGGGPCLALGVERRTAAR